MPDTEIQQRLIRSTLLTFNDANLTAIYTVLHAKMSKPFRDQFSPDKLKAGFKGFSENQINLSYVATMAPIPDKAPSINDKGVLSLVGHFATSPKTLKYGLEFIQSDGEWKPVGLNVDIE